MESSLPPANAPADTPAALEPRLRDLLDAPASKPVTPHPIDFTGSDDEYFRVWIVNLLLVIVTLGLYTPWARRRTAQYFYSHTHVAGSPLEFAGSLRRMVFGFLLFAALYLTYEMTSRAGHKLAASLLFFGFLALAPFLWGSAMRFRLGATRWRGIRLAFTASWKEVYLGSWPALAVVAIWMAVPLLLTPLRAWLRSLGGGPLAIGAVAALALALALLCVIRLEFNYKRLLVTRARIGGQTGYWKPAYLDFVKIWLAAIGIFLLILVPIEVLAGWWITSTLGPVNQLLSGAGAEAEQTRKATRVMLILLLTWGTFLAMVFASVPARAYREARIFQLVWNNVGLGQIARARTNLRTGAYVRLRVKNALLTLLTLGFYRPFARFSEYAAKAGSVTLHVKGNADQLAGELVRQQGGFADAAADALGLDLIG